MLLRVVVICALAALAGALLAPRASAAGLPTFGPKRCLTGSAAGQCLIPRGIAINPTNGHLVVADQSNRRIVEFTAWGEFVKAWGWDVKASSPEEKLQVCTAETGCQGGTTGAGVGQFGSPQGVAVDSAGNVYVVDRNNFRVEKFDSEGNFLLMFGGGVDQGPNHPGNVCTAAFLAEGDTCGAGTAGTANGQFSSAWPFSSYIGVNAANEVFVGDSERIQVFNSGGVYQRQLPIPQPGAVGALAIDPVSGDLYMAYLNGRPEFEKTISNVYRLNSTTGAVLQTLEVFKPSALATDGSGNLFVFDQLRNNGNSSDPENHSSRILEFSSTGSLLGVTAETPRNSPGEINQSTGIAAGSQCFDGSSDGLYVGNAVLAESYIQSYGPTPDPAKCLPPQVPPSLDAQYTASADNESALLRARINPHYFTSPVGTTTFYVQWATAACVEGGGWSAPCVKAQPAAPGAVLKSEPVDADVVTPAVLLGGLAPNTTYRFRFVAEGTGEPGEVIGVGGKPGVEGTDAAFTTMPAPTVMGACPNDAFRLGAGANLRDCRAYELVSPLDKAGGDVQARLNVVPSEARMDQASTSGDAITYSSYRPFGEAKGAPFSSQYISRRNPATGWATEAVSPPQEGEAFINPLLQVDNSYRAFTADLGAGWLQTDTEPVLGTGGVAGHPNIYRRSSSGGTYEACTSALPQEAGEDANTHGPQLQGFSRSGELGVFRIEGRLTENASTEKKSEARPINEVYACAFEGGVARLRLVSVLPNGTASNLENTTGGPSNGLFEVDQGRIESLSNAVSEDGSEVFWTATSADDGRAPGALYLRRNPVAESTPSGECSESEPEKACTIQISAGPARFWTASANGSIALFSTSAGDLNEYEVATAETRLIAHEVVGVLGASRDATRVYYLSEAANAQAEAEGAVAGEPNLYLYESGEGSPSVKFVAKLSQADAVQGSLGPSPAPSPGNAEPLFHSSRVTPDGATVAFMSNDPGLAREVAGYDNTDQAGNLPAAEIYRYAIGQGLSCISCNRTGARPTGREVQNKGGVNPPLFAAAMLPTWLNSLYAPRDLSEDGKRIFFESFEPLVLSDTNGKADVYQWEQKGTGTCTEADSGFDPSSGGCISLISSGAGSSDSQFIDASPNGNDVFIRTDAKLVGWDPGQIDVYDARANGGFSAPPSPEAPCQGESCQLVVPAPQDSTPASTIPGPGNLQEKGAGPKHCPKGTHKKKQGGKVRCVKNHKAKPKKHGRRGRNH